MKKILISIVLGFLALNFSIFFNIDMNGYNISLQEVKAGWDWDGEDDDDCDNLFWDCTSLYVQEDYECTYETTTTVKVWNAACGCYVERTQTSTGTGVQTECLSNGPDFCIEDSEC